MLYMQVYRLPDKSEWASLLQRPAIDAEILGKKVQKIIRKVRKKGDEAVLKYTARFDGVQLDGVAVTATEISEAAGKIPETLKASILQAKKNIAAFHAVQVKYPRVIETMPGIACWRKMVPIEKVGLYVPGGSAPLFSTVLMLGIPAALAGCKEIVLCTPPGKDGSIHPAVLFAAELAGITTIIKAGGVQAIAAMAFGTETVPAVYKIFGPGNQYVTAAKAAVQQMGVAIDMPAGPSEVAIFADSHAQPAFIAADLLSQAEHGPDSQVILVGPEQLPVEKIELELSKQLEQLPRKEMAARALSHSKIIIVQDEDAAMALLNAYAPEHLILNAENADLLAEQVLNAGSVFIGQWSPESVGDYASGTNHTLPTNGFARVHSGVSVDSFVKKITFQKLTREGLENIAPFVEEMAMAEGLQAHAIAVSVRRGENLY